PSDATSATSGEAPSQVAPPSPAVSPRDRYKADEILGLSADALRKRALKIVPWKTAWIGRVDTIPPQSDERTAIIDRGLILRGLLSVDQIDKIHEVGDKWLRHHEAAKLAEAAAHVTVEKALEAERREKAARRLKKREEAVQRKAARAEAVARRRAEDIIYLGRGVSARLNDRRVHVEELQKNRVPLLASPADIA